MRIDRTRDAIVACSCAQVRDLLVGIALAHELQHVDLLRSQPLARPCVHAHAATLCSSACLKPACSRLIPSSWPSRLARWQIDSSSARSFSGLRSAAGGGGSRRQRRSVRRCAGSCCHLLRRHSDAERSPCVRLHAVQRVPATSSSLRPDLVEQALPDVRILGLHRSTQVQLHVAPVDQTQILASATPAGSGRSTRRFRTPPGRPACRSWRSSRSPTPSSRRSFAGSRTASRRSEAHRCRPRGCGSR